MFAIKRIKGFVKFITDEAPHKRALQDMAKLGLYEFEFITDSIEDIIAARFSVADGSLSAEKETLFKEFYSMYWELVDKAKRA